MLGTTARRLRRLLIAYGATEAVGTTAPNALNVTHGIASTTPVDYTAPWAAQLQRAAPAAGMIICPLLTRRFLSFERLLQRTRRGATQIRVISCNRSVRLAWCF